MKICIIFSHFYVNDVVLHRVKRLKELNPDCDIITVGLSGYNLLPDSIYIDRSIWPDNKNMELKNTDWSLGDLCVYETYRKYPNYDIYFLIEYDTAFNVSVAEFFPNIISQDCGMNKGPKFPIELWDWYKALDNSVYSNPKDMASTGPTTCLWWNRNLLSQMFNELINNRDIYNNMFSELRLGILTKKFTDIKLSKKNINVYILFFERPISLSGLKYFFHPAKKLLNDE